MALHRTRTVLMGLTGLAVAGSMAGLGTFASFTDSTAASTTIASGTVNIDLAANGPDNRLSVGASGLVPGDSLQRRVKLTNAGSESLASISLTTSATTSSLLDTNAANGLQMKIERCAGTWTEVGTSAPFTYTCSGAVSSVLARRPIVGAALPLTGMASLAAGATDDVVVTVDLPTTADNSFQGLSSTVSYTFDAVQRSSASK